MTMIERALSLLREVEVAVENRDFAEAQAVGNTLFSLLNEIAETGDAAILVAVHVMCVRATKRIDGHSQGDVRQGGALIDK